MKKDRSESNIQTPGTYKFENKSNLIKIIIVILDLSSILFISMLFLNYIVYAIIVTIILIVFNYNAINRIFYNVELGNHYFTYKSPFLYKKINYSEIKDLYIYKREHYKDLNILTSMKTVLTGQLSIKLSSTNRNKIFELIRRLETKTNKQLKSKIIRGEYN